MTEQGLALIEERLLKVVGELEVQTAVASSYAAGMLPFADEMARIREFVDGGEYGLAYELEVATIETHPFVLSAAAAIALLELGLLFGFKTDREKDAAFDKRT